MLRKTLVLVLLLAAYGSAHAQERRAQAYVDPRFARHISLIDSLVMLAGAPDSVLLRRLPQTRPGLRRTGNYDVGSRRVTVWSRPAAQRRTLLHEFGHVFDSNNPAVANGITLQLGDDDPEHFADAFADAFEVLARGDTTSNQRGVRFLIELLRQRAPFQAMRSTETDASYRRPYGNGESVPRISGG